MTLGQAQRLPGMSPAAAAVVLMHLKKVGANLTTLSQEQADYINVPVEGPYKSEHYRY
jgi:S-adenosylhomocysteine hydrolase